MRSHGTQGCYRDGCRCLECRGAVARRRAQYRANRRARLRGDDQLGARATPAAFNKPGNGGLLTTLTHGAWAKARGYDPETRTYA